MTADELRAALEALDMPQRVFAAHLGVAPNTVYRWTNGGLPVPGYAVAFVEMLLRDKQPREPAQ
jgi:DNA-binding transcriptional regulator YiaG